MYNANKRHKRYLDNQIKEQEQARNRYNGDSIKINEARRKNYHDNLQINREKLRLRQQKRRNKLRSGQDDTNDGNTLSKAGQDDTKQ